MPRTGILGFDVGKAMHEFYKETGSPDHSFLLPDVVPSTAGLHATGWDVVAMSQSKIMALTHAILHSVGVPEVVGAQLKGFYSARRVLPTLAHRLKFSAGERLDVGGWSEGQKALAMPQRYSEAKLDEQSSVRGELVKISACAVSNLIVANPKPTLQDEVNMTFSQSWKFWPKRGNELSTVALNEARSWLSSMFTNVNAVPSDRRSNSMTANDLPGDGDNNDDSSSPSLSSSSNSCEMDPPGSDIAWFLSAGRRGCLHLCVGDGLLACGRKLYRPEEAQAWQQPWLLDDSGPPAAKQLY